MKNFAHLLGIAVITVTLAACTTTGPVVPSGMQLPPRDQVIPDPEPKPKLPPTATVDTIALEYGAAFGRANQRLIDGGTNYDNLSNTLAARR